MKSNLIPKLAKRMVILGVLLYATFFVSMLDTNFRVHAANVNRECEDQCDQDYGMCTTTLYCSFFPEECTHCENDQCNCYNDCLDFPAYECDVS